METDKRQMDIYILQRCGEVTGYERLGRRCAKKKRVLK